MDVFIAIPGKASPFYPPATDLQLQTENGMAGNTDRFEPMVQTDKQRHFERDFLATWEACEFWDTLEIGVMQPAPGTFRIEEEDVLSYNRALGETHPLFVDPDYARRHAPDGTVLIHPVFTTTIGFWFAQPGAQGSWIRTPGARNPFQRVEHRSRMRVGDRLTCWQENSDRFWRRGMAYITTHALIYDQNEDEKAELWGTLILPPSREHVRAFGDLT